MTKRILLSTLALVLLTFGACVKDSVDFQQLDDETLASQIAADRNKEEVNPAELPAEALDFIELNHFDSYIETSSLVREKGYEVRLATDERVYFNLRGRRLQYRGGPLDGRCGRLGGELIPLDQLRPAIVEYVQENYPDRTILRAKRIGDRVLVLLGGHLILVFSADGVFELDGQHWVDCLSCVPAGVVDIPQDVIDMIQTRLPGAEIKRVCRRGERIILGVTWNDHRKILVFDQEWNFLFSHP